MIHTACTSVNSADYESVVSSLLYLTGADAVMLVYDVTNTATFDSLEDWLEACRVCLAGAERRPSYALVANKIDQVGDSEDHYHYINYDCQEHLRVIKSDRHHKFAQDNGLLTYAVSAR